MKYFFVGSPTILDGHKFIAAIGRANDIDEFKQIVLRHGYTFDYYYVNECDKGQYEYWVEKNIYEVIT